MGIISINKITEGMVIAADVKDPFGRILLNSGQTLQRRHIEIFKSYGLEEISINGFEVNKTVEQIDSNPEEYCIAAKELESIFVLTDRSWNIMDEIYQGAIFSKIRRSQVVKEPNDA